jgi:hypothetical protein
MFALSLKQPWAALLVHGKKTIEVRTWPPPIACRNQAILIHAARVPDKRPEAWDLVTPRMQPATKLLGGIIGAAVLVDWKEYRTVEQFAADQPRHRNEVAWFKTPLLYGLVFRNAIKLPFQPYRGQTRFFHIQAEILLR